MNMNSRSNYQLNNMLCIIEYNKNQLRFKRSYFVAYLKYMPPAWLNRAILLS